MNEVVDSITEILHSRYPGIIFVSKTDTSYVFRSADVAIIVRKASPFFSPKQELQRRIDASTSAKKSLGSLVGATRHYLLEDGKNSLLVKETPWIENLRRLNEAPLGSLLGNLGLMSEMRDFFRFSLVSFLFAGRMYDFLGKFRTKNFISNLLFSDNLYVHKEGLDHLYVDADWYFKTSDTVITGFPLLSYYKRVLIGLMAYVCGYIFFLFTPIAYQLVNKSKSKG